MSNHSLDFTSASGPNLEKQTKERYCEENLKTLPNVNVKTFNYDVENSSKENAQTLWQRIFKVMSVSRKTLQFQ